MSVPSQAGAQWKEAERGWQNLVKAAGQSTVSAVPCGLVFLRSHTQLASRPWRFGALPCAPMPGGQRTAVPPTSQQNTKEEKWARCFWNHFKIGRCSKFLCQKIPAWIPPATRSSLPQDAALLVLQRIPPSSEHQSQAPLTHPRPWEPLGVEAPETHTSGLLFLGLCAP